MKEKNHQQNCGFVGNSTHNKDERFLYGSEKHIALEIEPLNSEQSCVVEGVLL